jgi:hypothetical protein
MAPAAGPPTGSFYPPVGYPTAPPASAPWFFGAAGQTPPSPSPFYTPGRYPAAGPPPPPPPVAVAQQRGTATACLTGLLACLCCCCALDECCDFCCWCC